MLNMKDQKKRDRAALVAELERAGAVFRGGNAFCCPLHKKPHESNPSASVFESDTGWRYKCHACGAQGDVWDVIARNEGKEPGEVLKSIVGDSGRSGGKAEKAPQRVFNYEGIMDAVPGGRKKSYIYTDDNGHIKMLIIRSETEDGKTFRQARPEGEGFVFGAPAKPWPLYNQTLFQKAEQIVVVEGEKCADALNYFGITATTSPGGSKNAGSVDWTPLAGKAVVCWPDNDEAGRGYIADVVKSLLALPNPPSNITTIDPEHLGLGHKDDAADYVRRLWDDGKSRDEIADDLRAVFSDAEPVKRTGGGASDLQGEIEAVISGEIVTVPLQWRHLSKLTKAMKPGTITLLAGNPGASKSLMLLEQFATWFDAGYAAALYCLEETQTFHTRRMLAQRAGLAGLTDDDWTAANPEQARAAMQAHTGFIDAVSRRIWVCPDEMPTLADVADWIEKRCGDGFRVVCVDPITAAAHKTREIWNEDKMFLRRCEQTAKVYGASVLLVTHPVKAVALPELNTLAGSAAYGRFCQTAIWLQSHDEKESVVMTDLGRTTVTHNRTAHLLKTRNGKGQWLKLAFGFCEDTLRLREYGTIIKH